ncbi:hypothetical protein BDQ94DRAFT_178052 [Aspergillus welwitschiae]|uniref:Uncharacterized protein n=1 Tax=Aspergillus welwitschiae TaxID=1341132 RepID=A0A3F3Q551_9EURO|nr:hypothetical protein BDQ94DRAFT_178052 [Aspergillus welwitschiae]RDH34032.1 hypothetical protein BDQ94DRAFT_178052 [Aspergillus welwitschiae]
MANLAALIPVPRAARLSVTSDMRASINLNCPMLISQTRYFKMAYFLKRKGTSPKGARRVQPGTENNGACIQSITHPGAGKHFIMNARLKRLNAETMDPVSGSLSIIGIHPWGLHFHRCDRPGHLIYLRTMPSDTPVDEGRGSPSERSDSPPSQLVFLPPPNSVSSSVRWDKHPTFEPVVDPFFNLVARREDGRPRLFPPFSGWNDDQPRTCGDPYCKHDVVVREYALDKHETCESCGLVPAFGWFYRCGVDITGFSYRMGPGQAPVLSPWISDAIKAGHYTGIQKNILMWQKTRVLQTVAAEHTEHLVAFPVTEVIYGIGDDDDDENPHVDFVEDVSHAGSDQFAEDRPLIQSSVYPPCSHRACHNCAPYLQERAWLSIDEVCRDTTVKAPSQWDLRDRSISDANIVRNLGLRRFSPSRPGAEPSTSLTEDSKTPSALLKKLVDKASKSSGSSKPTKPTTTVLPALTAQIAGSVAGCFTSAPPTASSLARPIESFAAPSTQPSAAPLTAPPPPPHLEIPEWLMAGASSSTSRSTNSDTRNSQARPSQAGSSRAGPSGTSRRTPTISPQSVSAQGAWHSINKHPRRPNLSVGRPRTIVRVPATVNEEYEQDYWSGGDHEEDDDYDEDDEDDESGGCLLDLASRAEEDREHCS